VLALVGAFTVLGTLAAVVLGVVSLVSIARNRERVAGVGFAAFGILAGCLFTGLTVLALSNSELFGVGSWVRERSMADQIDVDGPLEVVVAGKGFAITRPSEKWGQARNNQVDDPVPSAFQKGRDLLLVQPARYAFVDVRLVAANPLGPNLASEDLRPRIKSNPWEREDEDGPRPIIGEPQTRKAVDLPPRGDLKVRERELDVRYAGQPWRFLIREYEKTDGQVYLVRGYTQKSRFAHVEDELRRALDSFRVLSSR
jgi:hypothetical protein